jgi:3-oxoacyl-[acyl-carrier protein] reductase
MTKVAVITGGNRGIGKEIALAYQAAGYQVFITSRSPIELVGCTTLIADLTKQGAADAIFDQIEAAGFQVDVLVANAGISREALLIRTSDDDIEDLLQTNLAATIKLCRRAAKSMMKQRSGSIILIGSVLGMSGSAGSTVYAATKSALIGLARSMARELGSRNVRVNVVAPGYVNTDMTNSLPTGFKEQVISQTPLGRIAEPAEIANTVLFLGSEDAGFITGALIPVDGGLGMGN